MTNSRTAAREADKDADVDATNGTASDAAQQPVSVSVSEVENGRDDQPSPAPADAPGGDGPDRGPADGPADGSGALEAALLADPSVAHVAESGDAETEVAIPPAHLLAIPGPAAPSPAGSDATWYQPNGEGGYDLMLVPLDGGAAERIDLPLALRPTLGVDGDPSGPTGPVWSPDGKMLALTCLHPDTGRDAIFVVEFGSGLLRPLVSHDADDRGPKWSDDSRVVAFTSRSGGRDRIAIAEARPPEGEESYAIYLTDGAQDDRDPAWLRTGAEIAFRRRRGDPATDDIWIVSIIDGTARQGTGREGRVGLGSQPAYRRAPVTSPDKPQVAYATNEKDWDLIAIANTDNGTGWTLAGEAGDKADPQWSPDGKRVAYVRTMGTVTNVCTKGTAAAVTDIQDPGHGIALHPRWLADGRLLYWYADSVRSPRLIVQQPGPKQPRTVIDPFAVGQPDGVAAETAEGESLTTATASDDPAIPAGETSPADGQPVPAPVDGDAADEVVPELADTPVADSPSPDTAESTTSESAAGESTPADSSDAAVVEPASPPASAIEQTAEEVRASIPPIDPAWAVPSVLETQTPDRIKLPGLLYRPGDDEQGATAGVTVVSVGDGPPSRATQSPDPGLQTIVRAGYPYYRLNVRGVPGLGRNVLDGLADLADFEAEADDIVTVDRMLRVGDLRLPDRHAILGAGAGGALALTTAGGRPGTFAAVIAIDPVTDWDREFDGLSPWQRAWYQRMFGLPLQEAGRYALRTPSTFAGVIDAPILLVTRGERRATLLAPLTGVLQELDVAYQHIALDEDVADAEVGRTVVRFLDGLARG